MPRVKKKSFFAHFLGDRNIAAVCPSSPHLIRRLIRHLDLPHTRTIVELGPADGVATKPILRQLPSDARYLAIERNPDFARSLRALRDDRLEVIEGDARQLKKFLEERGLSDIDAVIASIPFTYLKKNERRELVKTVRKTLKPGGAFIIFHQYSPLMMSYVKKEFTRVRLEFEPLNTFPCFLIDTRT